MLSGVPSPFRSQLYVEIDAGETAGELAPVKSTDSPRLMFALADSRVITAVGGIVLVTFTVVAAEPVLA